MIRLPSMADRTLAVLGLGRSGRSACRALRESGARVWAWDDDPGSRADAAAAGLPIVDLEICNWERLDRLVVSPGIPLTHPRPHRFVRRARAAGVPIVGDLELLVENEPDRRIVGITGTNGKSTTTALIAQLLRYAGEGVQFGGNIGLPVLDLLPKPVEDIYVLEMSSYQLELTERLRCAVAVILNVSPDHLERHGSLAGYVRAKHRILRNQRASDWAVLGVDDDHGSKLHRGLVARADRRVLPVTIGRTLERGVFVVDGWLHDAIEGPPAPVLDLRPLESLRGAHNWQNAAAAYGAVRALGLARTAAAAGLPHFKGLAHRLEPVAIIDGVAFVNDSKATNAEAAARALASFDSVYWIAGGRPKEGGIEAVLPWLDHVRHAYLIGEASSAFATTLMGRVPCTQSGDLTTAVRQAAAAARADREVRPVVLLAPACASFDQFRDFEHRGETFKALVGELEPRPAVAEVAS
jgi:UDP-N-acetylmuramoylalanine--D-glutamate ligase